MAFSEASTPSDPEAVVSAVSAFAQANGWTEEHFVAAGASVLGQGVLSLSRGDTVVTFRWAGIDSPQSIAMHHALAYPVGLTAQQKEEPWDFPTDSGSGTDSANLASSGRRISRVGAGPFVRLTMMSGATNGYVLCVLEYAVGKFRHFGFGDVLENKIGDWVGGGWVAGHTWSTSGSNESDPSRVSHNLLIDGRANGEGDASTVHARGLAGQLAADRFGVAVNATNDPVSTDGAGNSRTQIAGGLRSTFFDAAFQQFVPDLLTGVIQLTPALLFSKQRGADNFQALGFLPGVRMAQIANFSAGQEVTVGSDTWKFFPVTAKQNVGGSNEESRNMGLAYLKVV